MPAMPRDAALIFAEATMLSSMRCRPDVHDERYAMLMAMMLLI